MRTTIVPAQITTVEDKIAGNLSFTQILLFIAPVFIGAASFVLIPPSFNITPLKIVLVVLIAFIFLTLAIRIRGKLIIQWLLTMGRYNLRAQFHVYDKNDSYLRPNPKQQAVGELAVVPVFDEQAVTPLVHLPTSELVRIESAISDPRAKFHFTVEKGALRVSIHEVKEEGI